MDVPLLDLRLQYATIRDEVRAAVDDVLASQRFILGPHGEALERELAQLCRVPHAIGVASGTDALLLSLKALGVGPGDCVVTVPFTFFATAGAIVNCGARPVFVDVEDRGLNMDAESLATVLSLECRFNLGSGKLVHKASGAVVKAIVPVHLYGQCADMGEILRIAEMYSLPVVEDSCQAVGATIGSEFAGTMGDLGCLSFFPSKNLGGAGDGGMILSRNESLAARVRLLRNHGAQPKYYHAMVGLNSRLDEIQAAVLRVKLRHLSGWAERRRCHAAAYDREFEAAGLLGRITTPAVLPGRSHVFHQYVVRAQRRDELREFLRVRGIGTEVYYPLALHEQECFRYLGYHASDLPRSSAASRQVLALPVFPELTEAQRRYVVSAIAEFYEVRPE
jgi:dTDP-4-amino-4,6-dideoxygalactose transaminase